MKWVETHGMKPRTRAEKAFVRYRCGLESREAYRVETMRWNWSGHDFDIMAYAAAEERKAEAA